MRPEKRMIGAVFALLILQTQASAAGPLPKGNAAHGQQLFARCSICHQAGPGPGGKIGPNLTGVVGRKAGAVGGYAYSPAMKNSGLSWTAATLSTFLKAPTQAVPGTKMAFPGISDAQDRSDIVAYLQQFRTDGKK